jgi:hypothetical protein
VDFDHALCRSCGDMVHSRSPHRIHRVVGKLVLDVSMDFAPAQRLDEVALRLNQRPRKALGFQTPAVRLLASVALTR